MLEGKQMANQYNEDSIQILESQEAVRTRPAMYIGDKIGRASCRERV
jgi:DNA gyrase/topoisomerase IV subunit B